MNKLYRWLFNIKTDLSNSENVEDNFLKIEAEMVIDNKLTVDDISLLHQINGSISKVIKY